jgi:ATP-dependent Clp protease ATP-binding subunit ClpC
MVEATSIDETIEILNNIKDKYEDHHHVSYTQGALESAVKLSERYITDRYLPDKAIDVLDEVGARVHINNISVPQDILFLEEQVELIKKEKNQVVKSQRYEEAAQLRDREKKLLEQLDKAKMSWEEEAKSKRYTVTEDHVGDVVAMMTGIPVKRVNMNDGEKILNMGDALRGRIVGQDPAVEKLVKSIQSNESIEKITAAREKWREFEKKDEKQKLIDDERQKRQAEREAEKARREEELVRTNPSLFGHSHKH